MDRDLVTIFKNNEMIRFKTPDRIAKPTTHILTFLIIISPLILEEEDNV